MSKYKIILFDLDGTIIDSEPGIIKSVLYALRKSNITENNNSSLKSFIGPPLKDSFMKYYGMDSSMANKAIEYYREYYKGKGVYETSLYPGIADLLDRLKNDKRRLFLATCKPSVFAVETMKHYKLDDRFEMIIGGNPDGSMSTKTEIIEYIIGNAGNTDINSIVMVGDRDSDIEGAVKNGIDSIGVKYGFGVGKELEKAGPTYIVKNIGELSLLLLGK